MKGRIIEVVVKAGARERGVSENPDGTFTVKTTFPPEKGRANRDVMTLIADHLGIAKSRVEMVSGHTYFRKRLRIV